MEKPADVPVYYNVVDNTYNSEYEEINEPPYEGLQGDVPAEQNPNKYQELQVSV